MTHPADQPLAPNHELSAEIVDDDPGVIDTGSLYRNMVESQENQQRALDTMLERIQALEAHVGLSKDVAPPLDWAHLTSSERRGAWQELGMFVEGLVHRYEMHREILPCWWRHGDVVEELGALRGARQLAYAEGADPSQAAQWHDTLERIRHRISGRMSTCRNGHLDMALGTWMPPAAKAEFAQMAMEQPATEE